MIHITSLKDDSTFEMAECKGLGHPDTICDAIAEEISKALCKYYLTEFGSILHYNVDKALLVSGSSLPKYKGGLVTQPMELYLGGQAMFVCKGKKIPVDDIAMQAATQWLKKHLRFVDVTKHIKIIPKIRPGSADLIELFDRSKVPLATDTSFGVAYFPLTPLEKKVKDLEALLNSKAIKAQFPFIGEDVKVMGVQTGQRAEFTISIAIVDRFIANIDDYKAKIQEVHSLLTANSSDKIEINKADDYEKESIYLTVTGTSAEAGDDGQVGRGNRLNGLITPYRPMTLEAYSGKNPVNHVGKLYSFFADILSRELCENHFAEEAQVLIVSQIGKPLIEPQLLDIRLKNPKHEESKIRAYAEQKLLELPMLWKQMI
jgi:S-adenosylmethionine synthetase